MKPYYDCDGITIYHADCRDVLPSLEPVDLVMTDPPYGILRQTRGKRAVGIEREERYCEIAVNRLAQGVLQF